MERKRLASDEDYKRQLEQHDSDEEARYAQDAENLRRQDATLNDAPQDLGDQNGQESPVPATPEQINEQRAAEAEKVDASIASSVPSEGSSSPESRGEVAPVDPPSDEKKS
jgi:hypothetical protein